MPAACDKKYCLIEEKRDATFHLRVLRYAPDHAVFPVATINSNSADEKTSRLIIQFIVAIDIIIPTITMH